MSEEIPPQFSPDGRYWWDGEQWIPVEDLPRPLVPVQQAHWDDGDPGRARRLLLIIPVGVALLLVFAAVAGAVTGLIHLPLDVGRGTASPTPHPSAVSPTPKPTPTPSLPVLPGLTAQSTLDYFSTQDIACNQPVTDQYHHEWWYCSKRGTTAYVVGIAGTDPQHILLIKASVNNTTPPPDQQGASDFLAAVAGVPYGDADPQQAQTWVRGHMGGGTTKIGHGTFLLSPGTGATKWSVDITPS